MSGALLQGPSILSGRAHSAAESAATGSVGLHPIGRHCGAALRHNADAAGPGRHQKGPMQRQFANYGLTLEQFLMYHYFSLIIT